MSHPNAQGRELKKILLHNICNEIFLRSSINPPWFNSLVRQILKLTFFPSSSFPPVRITKPSSLDQQPLNSLKISPLKELLSKKECQLYVERFIWVNLYSLDLSVMLPNILLTNISFTLWCSKKHVFSQILDIYNSQK